MDAWINPVTGSYETVADGSTLARDPADGLANAVYLRITTPLGSFWANPLLGSRLHELQREKDVARVRTLAPQYCEQALQPLLDDGRVSQLSVQTEHQEGRLAVLVELLDAAQNARTFQLHVKVG